MIRRLLIANRGEIAVRIARTASVMGIATVAVFSEDDRNSAHLRHTGEAHLLPGSGPAAYLNIDGLLAAARATGCDALHPGYGFLSETAAFARACAAAGICFVGPTPEQLQILGDKAQARARAIECALPVLAGTSVTDLGGANAFMAKLGRPVMVKALAGGGGRGIRLVTTPDGMQEAFARCASEAERAFGDGRLYVEQALMHARHIEIQLVGDGKGGVVHLGERDCTVQRRNQKLIEISPSPHLPRALAERMYEAALRLAHGLAYANAGTFEFLVDLAEQEFYFLEVNPRLQVEHTVTEALWGIDLVETQLRIAAGETVAELGLDRLVPRRGYALQARINLEVLAPDGTPMPQSGVIATYEPPGGPGIRIDGFGYGGYATNPRFDSLLAKVIVHDSNDQFRPTALRAARALEEFQIDGVATNIPFLHAILLHPRLLEPALTTRFVDDHLPELLIASACWQPQSSISAQPAGAQTVLEPSLDDRLVSAMSPCAGVIVDVLVPQWAMVRVGQPVAVVEAMKMQHEVAAPASGEVVVLRAVPGAEIAAGQILLAIRPDGGAAETTSGTVASDPDAVRADLAEAHSRHAGTQDDRRPAAVAMRRAKGARTARENIAAVCDDGSFIEFGPLVVAGQRRRRTMAELIARTPADGVVLGFGIVNGQEFPPAIAQTLLIAFDDSVLAGTVGEMAREKMKHALATAEAARRPVVLFAEGGGGRAGDTDGKLDVTGWTMDVTTYHQLGRMSGLAPLIGVVRGRCFAANAGLLGCCDVIIATRDANIGVGGPAMIEGGRLGSYRPEEIGPMDVQTRNGVVDLLVENEEQAAAAARTYLAYFQGTRQGWSCADQRELRHVVPENRLRAYDVRRAITLLADTASVLELRRDFGTEIVTALIRVEGRALGVVANSPLHLGGAIGADGADKASRFMRLCEAYGLPLLMLCDTPGMMVGPEAERTGTVRRMGRMFVTGANLTVPVCTIVLRKAYGLGAELMAGGWFKAPRFVVSWPTGEFGGMNIEGNVKLAHAAELAAIADPKARQARFEALVATMHETGKALSVATHNEIDDVIDPADSRRWIAMGIMAHKQREIGTAKTVPFVDPW